MKKYSQAQYDNLNRRKAFAWAQYYEERAKTATMAQIIIGQVIIPAGIKRDEKGSFQKPDTLPPHITSELMEMAEKLNKEYTCPVCFDLVNKETIFISWCGHVLCKACHDVIKPDKNVKVNCPTCRSKM